MLGLLAQILGLAAAQRHLLQSKGALLYLKKSHACGPHSQKGDEEERGIIVLVYKYLGL